MPNGDEKDYEKKLEYPFGNESYSEDYTLEDVMHIMNEGDWQSWNEMLEYLRNRGIEDENLDPSEFGHFIDDVMRLNDEGVPFTKDYKEVYRLGHENRPT